MLYSRLLQCISYWNPFQWPRYFTYYSLTTMACWCHSVAYAPVCSFQLLISHPLAKLSWMEHTMVCKPPLLKTIDLEILQVWMVYYSAMEEACWCHSSGCGPLCRCHFALLGYQFHSHILNYTSLCQAPLTGAYSGINASSVKNYVSWNSISVNGLLCSNEGGLLVS